MSETLSILTRVDYKSYKKYTMKYDIQIHTETQTLGNHTEKRKMATTLMFAFLQPLHQIFVLLYTPTVEHLQKPEF